MPALRKGNGSANRPAWQPGWRQILGLLKLPGVQEHPASVMQP
jgi:hypothetical protein